MGGLWGLAWTADSRDIVFAAGEWPLARLFRVRVAGGPIRPLTSLGEGTFAPAISAAGNRLAYMEWITSADIWQVRLGSDRRAIAEPSRLITSSRLDSDPAFSPDGERIAFRSNRTGRHGIWISKASGKSARLLEPVGRPGCPDAPEAGLSWSPDQASLAFANGGDLYVVDIPSGKCRALTSGATVDESPIWSPDGRWVYFSSFLDGTWQASRIPADGGRPAQLTRDGGRLRAVSRDGLHLYYAHDGRLWRVPREGGDPIEILDYAPDYLVATERGLFSARHSRTSRIQYFDLDSGSSTMVGEYDDVIMGFSVSPDESHLVYGLIDHKRADLMLVEGFR
jgi:Tol biopolymer transport system component